MSTEMPSPKKNLNKQLESGEIGRHDSFVTLGAEGATASRSKKHFPGRTASFNQTSLVFDLTGVLADSRLKPQSLRRHRKSEFEQYLPRHFAKPANLTVTPFATDEKGRLQQTQVMDHIIKLKKNVSRKNEKIKQQKKLKNEETFVNYLLEKKQIEK